MAFTLREFRKVPKAFGPLRVKSDSSPQESRTTSVRMGPVVRSPRSPIVSGTWVTAQDDDISGELIIVVEGNTVRICNQTDLNQQNLLRQIRQLSTLRRNWNGYGAAPISPVRVKAAATIVRNAPSRFWTGVFVIPMTEGRLQLEWHDGRRSLELEFEDDTSIRYLKWDPQQGVEEEGVIQTADTDRISDLLSWFKSE